MDRACSFSKACCGCNKASSFPELSSCRFDALDPARGQIVGAAHNGWFRVPYRIDILAVIRDIVICKNPYHVHTARGSAFAAFSLPGLSPGISTSSIAHRWSFSVYTVETASPR